MSSTTEWRPVIDRGTTWEVTITLPEAQTDKTSHLILKSDYDSETVVADWSDYVTTGDDTIYAVAVTPAVTAAAARGTYYLYFKTQNAGDTVADVWADGILTMTGSDDT